MTYGFHEQIQKAQVLVEAMPYLQEFRGKTFVIKIGGSVMDDWPIIEGLVRDVVFFSLMGIDAVLVHGGGKAISRAMSEAGLGARFINGFRITDEATVEIVERTLRLEINPRLVQAAIEFGGKAVGVNGRDVFLGRKRGPIVDASTGEPADLGWVGEVVDFHLEEIQAALTRDAIPVVSPIASEIGTQHALNCNADVAAGALAGRLGAAKFIYLSDVLGVMNDPRDPKTLFTHLDEKQARRLIAEGTITAGMIPKVESALSALAAGARKVHMIDARLPHSLLLEIFTKEGIGTEIVR
ncbi:MAG: acetylglutamate kinase [Verrucomicrobiales bacterium]